MIKQVKIILFLSVLWFSSTIGYAQTTNYVYAYASDGNTDEILIKFINPQTGGLINYESSLTKPENQALIYASPSPDGRWIIFLFGNATQRNLILYDGMNNNQELIAQLQADETVWPELIYPQWSPNSRYITFLGRLLGDNQLYIHTYRVDFGFLDSWGLQNESPEWFAWSPDSRYLAVSIGACEAYLCRGFIRVYDVVAVEFYRTTEMQIAPVPPCQLSWSPNSHQLVFRLACDFAISTTFSEMFLWDLEEDSAIQLTNYTNSLFAETLHPYGTTYTTFWYDAQTLILAARVSQPDINGLIVDGSVIVQTLAYNLPSTVPFVLQNSFVNEWAKNPISNELAYLNETISVVSGEYVLQNAVVQIGNYGGQELSSSSTHPAGCDLRWSSDGAYLGYRGVSNWTLRSERDCREESQNLVFVNNNSRTIQQFDTSAISGFEPIGWVSVSNLPTPCGSAIPCAVNSLSLLDSTSLPISGHDPLNNNAVIDLATVTASPLKFQANTNPATVGSVAFQLDSLNPQIDDTAPYELDWTPVAGSYTLTATPYSGAAGTGTAGTPYTINFSVINPINRILYVHDGGIFSMNPDGTDVINLAGGGTPAWSPDGTRIAYWGHSSTGREIFVMNADGSNKIRLTNNSADDRSPSWSPDGTRIVYFSVQTNADSELFIMNADGTGNVQLTINTVDDRDPSWSPNGDLIAFNATAGGYMQLYTIHPDGSNRTRLINSSVSTVAPSWSPDGSMIVYTRVGGTYTDIYRINVDGSNALRLTNDAAVDQNASWSADGNLILFSSLRNPGGFNYFELYTMNPDGSNETRLTTTSNRDESASDWAYP